MKRKSSKARIRVGLVGAGFGINVLLPAFRKHPRFEVNAICTRNLQKSKRIALKHHISNAYGDWRSMIKNPSIDAVAIAVPPTEQARIAMSSAKAKKALFCEKPLAFRLNDALKLKQMINAMRIPNVMDFEFTEVPEWREAKRILNSGQLGRLRHVDVSWMIETYAVRSGLKSWKTNDREGGGALSMFVSHTFHYVEWLLGRMNRLHMHATKPKGVKCDGDSLIQMSLVNADGLTVSCGVSIHAYLGHGHRITFYGEKGTMLLDNPDKDYMSGFSLSLGKRNSTALKKVKIHSRRKRKSQDGRIDAVYGVVDDFAQSIDRSKRVGPDVNEGYRVQWLMEKAKESNRLGKWVRV